MSHDVFISYEDSDREFSEQLSNELEKYDTKCWIAPRDVRGEWFTSIAKAIKSSKVVVLVLSSNTANSNIVPKEIERAVNNRVPICGVRTENIDPPENLELLVGGVHWIEAWGEKKENCVASLLKQLTFHIPPAPGKGEIVTPRHVALSYDIWRNESDPRFKNWDKEIRPGICRMDLAVMASRDVINRIEYVHYFLHPSWKWAGSKDEYKIDDKETNFKVKELVWGNFLLYAEVHIDNQEKVPLSCYVQVPKITNTKRERTTS